MTESAGEIIGIDKRYDSVCLAIFLTPEESTDISQIFEWRIGEKVKVVGNEPKDLEKWNPDIYIEAIPEEQPTDIQIQNKTALIEQWSVSE